jgi:hypothetical protein
MAKVENTVLVGNEGAVLIEDACKLARIYVTVVKGASEIEIKSVYRIEGASEFEGTSESGSEISIEVMSFLKSVVEAASSIEATCMVQSIIQSVVEIANCVKIVALNEQTEFACSFNGRAKPPAVALLARAPMNSGSLLRDSKTRS